MTRHLIGQVAQSVEQRTENPRVGGSIPSLTTSNFITHSSYRDPSHRKLFFRQRITPIFHHNLLTKIITSEFNEKKWGDDND